MAEQRAPRELETREKTERKKAWAPAALLPDVNPRPGFGHRWIRLSTLGQLDPSNVASKFREGWTPVLASEYPEITIVAIENERFKDNVVIGGLILCRAPIEMLEQRDAYYRGQAEGQMRSVDNDYMREDDPRMKKFSEKKTTVSFGRGE